MMMFLLNIFMLIFCFTDTFGVIGYRMEPAVHEEPDDVEERHPGDA